MKRETQLKNDRLFDTPDAVAKAKIMRLRWTSFVVRKKSGKKFQQEEDPSGTAKKHWEDQL